MAVATRGKSAPADFSVSVMEGPQEEFVFSEAAFPGLFSGRAGGKTIASVVKAFKMCFDYPGIAGCLTEPTYKQVNRVLLPAMRRMWGPLEGSLWEFKKADMEVVFSNGSVIFLGFSEDPNSVRGLDISFFGMDEARVGNQHETFLNLVPARRQKGFPHQGWVTTTPAGRNHWLYWHWVEKRLPTGEEMNPFEYVMYEMHTEDNIHLTESDLASWKQTYGNTNYAEQELFGRFVIFEGQAFPEFNESHVRSMPSEIRVKRVLHGFDWGDVNPTAVVELKQDESNNIWVTDLFYERRCDMGKLVEALGEMRPTKVLCDPNTRDEIEYMRKAGIPAQAARSNAFKMRYQLVQRRIVDKTLFIDPSCIDLIGELQGLEFASDSAGELGKRWRQGLPDHAYDALAYALMELDQGALGAPHPRVILRRWGHN